MVDRHDLSPVAVASQAPDRATYLRRPDLGRRLAPEDAARLAPGDHAPVKALAADLLARATPGIAPHFRGAQ